MMLIKKLLGICECKGCKNKYVFDAEISFKLNNGKKKKKNIKLCREHAMEITKGGKLKSCTVEQMADEAMESEDEEEQGLLLRLPCKAGDTIYIVATCDKFPSKLDGTMWDSDGGYGTATGYYCPYEENCPHSPNDCSGVESKLNIFEDVVSHICIEEDKIWYVCDNSNGWELKDFGTIIFLTRAEAEQALPEVAT